MNLRMGFLGALAVSMVALYAYTLVAATAGIPGLHVPEESASQLLATLNVGVAALFGAAATTFKGNGQ